MLNKTKSRKAAILKYGLSAPLFAAMLILSSATIKEKVEASEQIAKLESHNLREAITAAVPEVFNKALKSEGKFSSNTTTQQSIEQKSPTVTQSDSTEKAQDFATIDTLPEFPGGQEGFSKYIMQNFTYSPEARKQGVSGKVIISFVVEKDGDLTNIKVLRDMGLGTGTEAVRILENSPKWSPGKQKGKLVRVNYVLPISLKLEVEGEKTGNNTNIIYILDGKEITEDEYNAAINAGIIKATHMDLRPNSYGERGQHGVINAYANTAPPKEVNTNSLYKAETTLSEIPPLIILDGKEISQESFRKIDQRTNKFKSSYILTDKDAINKYGEKGKNGVVEVYMDTPFKQKF